MIAIHRLVFPACIAVASLAALGACDRKAHQEEGSASEGHEENRRRETILTGARIESRDYVAGRMADARCERESTCMDVGPGRRFPSSEACLAALRPDSLGHLTRLECPKGTDPRGLEKCLGAIRGEVCPRAIEQLEHLEACRAESLCYRPSTP
jgi:hypothetical protein